MAKENMTCWECKGKYLHKMMDFEVCGVNLGKFKAKVCNKCGDTVFEEEVSDKIEVKAKQKGVWGLKAHTKVGKVGNSLDIRIADRIAKFLHLKKGTGVEVYPESRKRLIIELA